MLAAAQWALEHLASSQTAIVLVREMNEKPIDGLVTWTTPLDVFYPIKNSSRSLEDIADLMEDACIVNEEFMILTSSDKLDASNSRTLSENELIGLVASATGVVLAAYDGESYIRWSRTS